MNDAWDWVTIYYVGTVLLHMSEERFWHCTLRKLRALYQMYLDVNSPGEDNNGNKNMHNVSYKKSKTVFIDQVF